MKNRLINRGTYFIKSKRKSYYELTAIEFKKVMPEGEMMKAKNIIDEVLKCDSRFHPSYASLATALTEISKTPQTFGIFKVKHGYYIKK